MGSQPLVLIAGLEGTHTLFALERESRGLYALFQLGSWINLEQLRGVAVASTQVIPKPSGSVYPSEASVPPMIPENNRYSKKKRLAIELIQSMVKRPPPNIVPEFPNADLESSTTNVSVEATTSEITLPKTDTPPVVDQIQAQPTGAEIVDSVRNQYLEALYLSKVKQTSQNTS
jgi:DNA replication regulator SLD3